MEFMTCKECKGIVQENLIGICLKCQHEIKKNKIEVLKEREKEIKVNLKRAANKKK